MSLELAKGVELDQLGHQINAFRLNAESDDDFRTRIRHAAAAAWQGSSAALAVRADAAAHRIKRDELAKAALTGILASPLPAPDTSSELAQVCYEIADAMLAESEKHK